MGRRYRIGQAAAKLGLNPSVLRYWESEFPQLEPVRTRKGQRLYTEEHLELLERIQAMVHGEGLTIEGARRRLEQEQAVIEDQAGDDAADAPVAAAAQAPAGASVEAAASGDLKREMVEELLELKRLLRG